MLTIGELARLAGTTVRAVRHYHALGVLPEPGRDSSGYRRYGARALVRLVRIRRLRELGVPLSRVQAVLDADEPFDAALDRLDAELAARAAEIAAQRARIAEMRAECADPDLPAPLGELFAAVAAQAMAGVAGGTVPADVVEAELAREKEAVLLILALEPEALDDLVQTYRRLLDDTELSTRMTELNERFLALADEPVDSPAVEELIEAVFADPAVQAELAAADPDHTFDARSMTILGDYLSSYAPAQHRFLTEAMRRAQEQVTARPRARGAARAAAAGSAGSTASGPGRAAAGGPARSAAGGPGRAAAGGPAGSAVGAAPPGRAGRRRPAG